MRSQKSSITFFTLRVGLLCLQRGKSDAWHGKYIYIWIYIHTHTAQNIHRYWFTLLNTMVYSVPWQGSSTKWICNPWKRWVFCTPIRLWNVVNISCEGLEVQCSVQAEIPFEILPPFDQCCPVKGQSCSVIRIMIFSTVVFYLIFLVFLLLRFWN